jgi:hypothetical protein
MARLSAAAITVAAVASATIAPAVVALAVVLIVPPAPAIAAAVTPTASAIKVLAQILAEFPRIALIFEPIGERARRIGGMIDAGDGRSVARVLRVKGVSA